MESITFKTYFGEIDKGEKKTGDEKNTHQRERLKNEVGRQKKNALSLLNHHQRIRK